MRKNNYKIHSSPKDTITPVSKKNHHRFIAPDVQKAKETFPQAKKRFIKGLPKGSSFCLTVGLNENGTDESVLIKALAFSNGQIFGVLATKTPSTNSFTYGSRMIVDENEITDWTITSPEIQEEGRTHDKATAN